MSLNGMKTFSDNVKNLMKTKAWKDGYPSERGNMAYRLLNSIFGIGIMGTVVPFDTSNIGKSEKGIIPNTSSACSVSCGYCKADIPEEMYKNHLWQVHRIGNPQNGNENAQLDGSQALCECRYPRTVWNGTLKQWICDDCGKPTNGKDDTQPTWCMTPEEYARNFEFLPPHRADVTMAVKGEPSSAEVSVFTVSANDKADTPSEGSEE